MSKKIKEKGFTIIEVVLVLAIAGLIFIMVFAALPALQRSQRDTARKNEISKVLSAITTYQSNNRGQSPAADDAFGKYVDSTTSGGTITLPSGTIVTNYTGALPKTLGTATTPANQDTIVFVIGAKCDVNDNVVKGSARQAAAVIQLEDGGGVYYCQTS